ncbi:MAG: hypothetical protein ACPG4X_15955 [Pikeienuella sp.]
MFYERITAGQTTAPKWTVCDREIDITDIWLEETDPLNERNEVATAYLEDAGVDGQLEVAGISITEPEGDKTYRDRNWAGKVLGWGAIYRIEQYEYAEPGCGDDIRYDEWKESLS